jgi:hypothetical protein
MTHHADADERKVASKSSPLPVAPDDGFPDSRSTQHKRLSRLLWGLEYAIETPGAAIRLLLLSSSTFAELS